MTLDTTDSACAAPTSSSSTRLQAMVRRGTKHTHISGWLAAGCVPPAAAALHTTPYHTYHDNGQACLLFIVAGAWIPPNAPCVAQRFELCCCALRCQHVGTYEPNDGPVVRWVNGLHRLCGAHILHPAHRSSARRTCVCGDMCSTMNVLDNACNFVPVLCPWLEHCVRAWTRHALPAALSCARPSSPAAPPARHPTSAPSCHHHAAAWRQAMWQWPGCDQRSAHARLPPTGCAYTHRVNHVQQAAPRLLPAAHLMP